MESKNKSKGKEMFQGHLLGQAKNPASVYQKEISEERNSKSTSGLQPHMYMCPHTYEHSHTHMHITHKV